MADKKVQHISVTLDLLRELEKSGALAGYGIGNGGKVNVLANKDHLMQALFVVGFDVWDLDEEGKKVPARIDTLRDVNVRCNNKPYLSRKCVVFAGRLREDFKYKNVYDNVDILDVAAVPDNYVTTLVSDFAFDVPVIDKVNTRKYTKREDRIDSLTETLSADQLEQLCNIFGE